ncbi:MAG TPA: O-antigen ligase family protein [Thermoleophilia bacterium]
MKVVESSLSFRAARRVVLLTGISARSSLLGRFFKRLRMILGPVFSASEVFGLKRIAPQPLGRTGFPLSTSVISRPYLWLRRVVGGGPVGRGARALGSVSVASSLGSGAWTMVVGGGVLGLGCGRLALLISSEMNGAGKASGPGAALGLRLVAPILLLVIGLLVVGAGPRLVLALRCSRIVRGGGWVAGMLVEGRSLAPAAPGAGRIGAGSGMLASSPGGRFLDFSWRRLAGPLGAAVILAAAAGLVGGLTSGAGPLVLVAAAVVIVSLVVVVWRPQAILLAIAAFPWLDYVARRVLGGFGPAWKEALLILAIVLLLVCVIVFRRWELWSVPLTLPVGLALVAGIGSVVVRGVPNDVGLFALRIIFEPMLYFFAGFLLPKSRQWVKWIVAVFLLSSVALALHGLYQYVTHAPMPAHWIDITEASSIGTRAYSIVGNPNGLGAFLLLGALVSMSLALARLKAVQRIVMAVVCVLLLAGVAVTFSRGAWIGLGVGVLALLIMAYRRYLAPLFIAAFVAWFAAPAKFTHRLTFAFSGAYITKSTEAGRLFVWKLALQHIAEHPWFGVGLGTFGGTSAVMYGFGRLWVDNFYLQLAAEGGLILLVLFLWILLRAAKGLVKSHKNTRDPYTRALTAGVFGGFMAVAAANATASVWETLIVGVGFWFLTGLATSVGFQLVGEEAASPPDHEQGWPAEAQGSERHLSALQPAAGSALDEPAGNASGKGGS